MELAAQWSSLSSAASYTKLPCAGRAKAERVFFQKALKMAWADGDGHQRRPQNINLPRIQPKNKKKPWITPPRRGGFLRKLKRGPRKIRSLPAPANGLLVPRLVPTAHRVLHDRSVVIGLIPKLMQVVRCHTCRYCTDTHVGQVGHEIATCTGPDANVRRARHDWTRAKASDIFPSLDTYHLYDRLKTIYHAERKSARLPALVELCIQAGVDLPEYPVLRRARPVKALGKRIIEETRGPEFEFDGEMDLFDPEITSVLNNEDGNGAGNQDQSDVEESSDEEEELEDDIDIDNMDNEEDDIDFDNMDNQEDDIDFDNMDNQEDLKDTKDVEEAEIVSKLLDLQVEITSVSPEEVAQVAQSTLNAWVRMRNGVKRLAYKYPVRVCGYCPEVHIGPRGHKVKLCGAFKHQWRNGQHGWQKATLEDLIPPKYVWHVKDLQAPLLCNQLRRYYGQAPAVVELCVQAGAAIPDQFRPLMRTDVVAPEIDEIYHAV